MVAMSYSTLSTHAQRCFRALSVHPGSFSAATAATIVGCSEPDVQQAIDELLSDYLLEELNPGEYLFYYLVREHAQNLFMRHDSFIERDLVVRRMLNWYVDRAVAADLALNPFQQRCASVVVSTDHEFTDAREARAWFARELGNLLGCQQLAMQHDLHENSHRLAEAMWNGLRRSCLPRELVDSQRRGARAAAEEGNVMAELGCLIRMAFGHIDLNDRSAAERISTDAIAQASALGLDWLVATGLATRARGRRSRDPQGALEDLHYALRLRTAAGDHHEIANVHRRLGELYGDRAIYNHDLSVEHLQTAVDLLAETDDGVGHARAVCCLAKVRIDAGEPTAALLELAPVLRTLFEHGAPAQIARALVVQGQAYAASHQVYLAHESWEEALRIFSGVGPGADAEAWRLRQELAGGLPQLPWGITISGAERSAMGRLLRERYDQGVSIRNLASECDRSFGFVRTMLCEAGAELKPRGRQPVHEVVR
ncbi:hypothetical protein D5S17_14685 [Pseudonocardiaceae bacterium YIM PH 21723]|nr:hypothetical protein D5S17_14685 [Pseudonocardiaceae bacterium YIM PH 21723]